MYIHIRAQVGQHPPDDVKLLFEGGSYFFVRLLFEGGYNSMCGYYSNKYGNSIPERNTIIHVHVPHSGSNTHTPYKTIVHIPYSSKFS